VAKTLFHLEAHLSPMPPSPPRDNKLPSTISRTTTNPGPDDEMLRARPDESIEGVLATLKERERRSSACISARGPGADDPGGDRLAARPLPGNACAKSRKKALARLRHVSRARALEASVLGLGRVHYRFMAP